MEFLAITLVIFLAAISPGPDFVLVIKNSLQHNRQAGFFTALGVSCSLLIHSIYCILGLAIIISQSLILFATIKYIGALYLAYIGIKCLLAKSEQLEVQHIVQVKRQQPLLTSFTQGLLCNLLNPKAIMFILAFFTLIIHPDMPWKIQFIYCGEIALVHFIWFSFLALIITYPLVREKINRVEHIIMKVMGIVLLGFAIEIATLANMGS